MLGKVTFLSLFLIEQVDPSPKFSQPSTNPLRPCSVCAGHCQGSLFFSHPSCHTYAQPARNLFIFRWSEDSFQMLLQLCFMHSFSPIHPFHMHATGCKNRDLLPDVDSSLTSHQPLHASMIFRAQLVIVLPPTTKQPLLNWVNITRLKKRRRTKPALLIICASCRIYHSGSLLHIQQSFTHSR